MRGSSLGLTCLNESQASGGTRWKDHRCHSLLSSSMILDFDEDAISYLAVEAPGTVESYGK